MSTAEIASLSMMKPNLFPEDRVGQSSLVPKRLGV
jgi:hypothetical protein